MGIEYMEGMKKLYPDLHTDISLFFMHFTCSWWVNMMKEVVQHEELSVKKLNVLLVSISALAQEAGKGS